MTKKRPVTLYSVESKLSEIDEIYIKVTEGFETEDYLYIHGIRRYKFSSHYRKTKQEALDMLAAEFTRNINNAYQVIDFNMKNLLKLSELAGELREKGEIE